MAISKFKFTAFTNGGPAPSVATTTPIGFLDADTLVFRSADQWAAQDTNTAADIYTKNLATGEIKLISATAEGASTWLGGTGAVLSQDHTKILFSSAGPLTPGEQDQYTDLFVKTISTGEITRVSTAGDIPLPGGKWDPEPNYQGVLGNYAISPDNSKVAFYGNSPPHPGLNYGVWDIFVRDLTTGAFTPLGVGRLDGVQLAFSADSSKLIYQAGPAGNIDILSRDLATGAVTEISTSAAGVSGDATSSNPVVSPTGDKVAFLSLASNLVLDDTPNTRDLFLKTLSTGAIERIAPSFASAMFTPDGSKLVFQSAASDLVPGDTNGAVDLFVKSLATGVVTRLSPTLAGSTYQNVPFVSMTPDGSKLALALQGDSGIGIFVTDLDGHNLVEAASYTGELWGLALSPDGTKVFIDTGPYRTTGIPFPGSGTFEIDLARPGDYAPVAGPSEVWITAETHGVLKATDADTATLKYFLLEGPTYGQLTLGEDGTYTYKPPAGFVGDEFFRYRVTDGDSKVDTYLSFHVLAPGTPIPTPGEPLNTAPVANPISFTQPEDQALAWGFSARDAENDAVTYRIIQDPLHGKLTLGPKAWDFKYTPDPNYNGNDSFTFAAVDSNGAQGAEAKFSIRITPVNDAPVALPGVISTTGPVQAAVGGVDVDSSKLVFSVTQRPAHGDLAFNTDGTFTYVADPGFVGSDYFVFAVSDGALSSTSTMTLRVFGAAGETVVGGSGDDTLRGGWGGDTLTGLGGNDTLIGDRGNDILDGGKGDDIMSGGLGDDIYYVDSRADQVRENVGEGVDEIRTGLSLALPDNVENLTLLYSDSISGTGNGLANTIIGNAGANLLKGGGGTDILIGIDGDDILIGQSGGDTLTGGAGADIFQFDSVSDIGFGVETIVDFSSAQGDRIDLRGIDANLSVGGDQAFTFIGEALFHKVAGELRATALGAGYVIQGDVNGDGKADFSLLINAQPLVTDFLL